MFSSIRSTVVARSSARAFSTTRMVAADLSKLTLIGRLGRDPETRKTRNDEEYISYTVATTNYPAPPPNPDGTRREPSTTWHSVYCFQPGAVNYLKTLKKGTRVYVEANFELRDPDPTADPDSPQGQRQIFLKHEAIRVIQSAPKAESGEEEHF